MRLSELQSCGRQPAQVQAESAVQREIEANQQVAQAIWAQQALPVRGSVKSLESSLRRDFRPALSAWRALRTLAQALPQSVRGRPESE